MIKMTNIIFFVGISLITFSILNIYYTEQITPALVRAESLAGISSIIIITISFLWDNINIKETEKVTLKGKEGFYLLDNLDQEIKNELAWGSHLILTATAASTILIHWEGKTILKRGLLSDSDFTPGEICKRAIDQHRLVSLVNTSLFPGSYEFDSIINELPSIIIYPISTKGLTIVGGWSKRCFTKADEKWISGWSEKIYSLLDN